MFYIEFKDMNSQTKQKYQITSVIYCELAKSCIQLFVDLHRLLCVNISAIFQHLNTFQCTQNAPSTYEEQVTDIIIILKQITFISGIYLFFSLLIKCLQRKISSSVDAAFISESSLEILHHQRYWKEMNDKIL